MAGLLAAAAVLAAAYAIAGGRAPVGFWARRLRRAAGLEEGTMSPPEPEFGSLSHSLALLGLRVPPGRERLAYFLILAAGGLLGLAGALALGLPHLPALGGAGVGALAARHFIRSRIDAMRRRLERELPAALHRIAALMALSANVIELMRAVSSSLLLADPDSPLGRELYDAAQRVAAEGPAAWHGLMERARLISPSLELLYYQLFRFSQAGGAQFAEALRASAAAQARLLDARERARGKGDAAISSLRIIALVMVGLLTFLVVDPVYSPVVRSLAGQILVAAAFAAMAAGYWLISGMVEDVL